MVRIRLRGTVLTIALGLSCLLPARTGAGQESPKGTMIAHMVYFDLKDTSGPAKAQMVEACEKYLKNHPGVVFFAAGTIAEDLERDVNVRDFHVSLHLVFRTRADHDRYQTAPAHLQFIKENSARWARVRVFDSYVR
jgi:hypothetical protein